MYRRISSLVVNVLVLIVLLVSCSPAQPTENPAGQGVTPTVVSGSGDISSVVDEYRNLLGADNGGEPGGRGPSGYREINWDGVPDEVAAPNFLPSDFFNAAEAPRARGAFLNTPGEGIQVSADSDNPTGTAPYFTNINPGYTFKTFSEERLFSP